MIDDTQLEYLVKFFDGGSLKRLQTQLANAEKAIARFEQRAKDANGEVVKLMNLQALADKQGFSSNVKIDRQANSLVGGGGAEAERKAAIDRGIIAKRNVEEAERVLNLSRDARIRLNRHFSELEKQQAIALTTISRQEFANREVLTIKQAQVKLEAAKLRAGQAAQAFAGNTDGRSTTRLSTNLANSQVDVDAAEKQLAAMKQTELISKRMSTQQTKLNASLERSNILRRDGNTLGAKKELQNARIAKAKLLEINQERLTSQELRTQVRLNESIVRAKTRIKAATDSQTNPLDSLNRRLQDGGAGLLKIQAQLLANYAAMGLAFRALSFAGRFVVELDKQFAQLQAITATTDQSMGKLEKTIIGVSEGVKFTALEVAEAATVMGQAGFSVDQITNSIGDITLLATAVGTDLNTAVDLVTSTISVFNLRAEEAGVIANVFTTAVNNSKLNLEKLTLGLQYAGNIANEQNITFSELTATLGAMANSGIRSGSTLGTGLRQILTALAAPSEKLTNRLTELGVSTDDVNVKLYGLTGVLRNLQNAGFTTSDALQVLEVRAGAAYAALTNNSSTIEDLRQKFLLSSAAAEANSVQMEALANKGAKLQSIFGTLAAKALNPLVEATKVGADVLAVLLTVLNKTGPVLGVVTTLVVGYTAAVIANRAAFMALNLVGKQHIAMRLKEAAALRASQLGFAGLAGAMGPVGLAIVGFTAAVALAKLGIDFFTESIDELKSKVDESTGKIDTYTQNIRSIDKELEILSQRHFEAGENMQELNNIALELQLKFSDLGASFNFTTGSAEGLKEELSRLKDEMLAIQNINLSENLLALDELQAAQRKQTLSSGRKFFQSVEIARTLADGNTVGGDSEIANRLQLPEGVGELGKFDALDDKSFDELLALRQELSNLNQTLVAERDSFRGKDDSELTQYEKVEKAYVEAFNDAFITYRNAVDRELGTASDRRSVSQQKEDNIFRQRDDVNAFETALLVQQAKLATAKANRSEFTNKGLDLPDGAKSVEAVVEETKKIIDTFNESLSEADSLKLLTTGIAANAQALVSRGDAALKMTALQLREEKAIFDQQQSNRNAEIENIKRSLNVNNTALEIAKGRARIMALLTAQEAEALANEQARLDREGITGAQREREETAFARSLELAREKVAASLDKLALDREVKARSISFESLELQLDKEIALERKRVTKRSSVYEINEARDRALALQADKELAAREDLRFRLRNDAALLDLEMVKLNATLAAERSSIEESFDGMHTEIRDKQVPQVKDALKQLTNSFDQAAKEFDRKVAILQNPVRDLQAQRQAMDTPDNASQYSDVTRRIVDREIRSAEITALKGEVELLKTEGLARLKSEASLLDAQRADMDARIARAEAVLANVGGQYSPAEMTEANTEINQLKAQRTTINDDILNKENQIVEAETKIRDLTRELQISTGQAAGSKNSWLESLSEGLEDYMRKLDEATLSSENFADTVGDVMGTFTDSLGDAFYDMATGAKSVGEAFGDMAETMLQAILKILAEQAAIFAVKSLLAAFGVPMAPTGAFGFREGGVIPVRRARGGAIPNVGVTGRDYTPVMAEAGEFMLRKSAVDSIGHDKLYAMNAMGNAALKMEQPNIILPNADTAGNREVNVYVMAPDEKPQLGPDDILHVIGQDIASGGQTKQLIKQVVLR